MGNQPNIVDNPNLSAMDLLGALDSTQLDPSECAEFKTALEARVSEAHGLILETINGVGQMPNSLEDAQGTITELIQKLVQLNKLI